MSEPFIPKRPVIATPPNMTEAFAEAEAIAAYFKDKGMQVPFGSLYEDSLRERLQEGEFDLLIGIGGDGTMLRAGHLCAPSRVPILGINLGRLGFLIQTDRKEWPMALDQLMAGEGWVENRMMLRAEHVRDEKNIGVWYALNEAVVGRGHQLRPVHLTACVDGRLLTRYAADGLIAATATGSTAYALAAGGPILPPELRNILLVPIAPHLSVDRAVVLAEGAEVSIITQGDNTVLSIDGQLPTELSSGDRVNIYAAEVTAQFVRFGDPGYFYRNLTAHMNQNPSIGLSR
jgi:NAD+ kinase